MFVQRLLATALVLATSAEAFAPQLLSTRCQWSRNSRTHLVATFMRKPFITGNWKLNPSTREEAIQLIKGVVAHASDALPDVVVFVPYPFMESIQRVVGDKVCVGAEAVFSHDKGAYTGGISPSMLKSMGVMWALAGHSERRTLFRENDEDINEQCKLLIAHGMNVVLCIGETEAEYENNLVASICEIQLKKGLAGISPSQMAQVTIAYEPIWAIGTGKVATPEIAQDVHAICRTILKEMYGPLVADQTRILYGGSVSPESVDGLMAKPDIDGTLVGGASLKDESFGRIINFVPSQQMAELYFAF